MIKIVSRYLWWRLRLFHKSPLIYPINCHVVINQPPAGRKSPKTGHRVFSSSAFQQIIASPSWRASLTKMQINLFVILFQREQLRPQRRCCRRVPSRFPNVNPRHRLPVRTGADATPAAAGRSAALQEDTTHSGESCRAASAAQSRH